MLFFLSESEGLGVHFTPRRERFMFREKHLEVLETFFKKVQYPTPEEKEHIANECNVAMAASSECMHVFFIFEFFLYFVYIPSGQDLNKNLKLDLIVKIYRCRCIHS